MEATHASKETRRLNATGEIADSRYGYSFGRKGDRRATPNHSWNLLCNFGADQLGREATAESADYAR